MSNEHEKRDNENYAKNFTRVCNIVLDSYNHLTHEEKFLYIKLRCVYWDARPRFATLREISHLTGYAISALSRILPRLDKCGLVHAEIKQEYNPDGSKKGKPKYYITLPDIWELNRKYYECSPEERFDPSVVLLENENVLLKNKNVLQKNENVLLENNIVPPEEHFCPTQDASQARSQRSKDKKDSNKDRMKDREGTVTAPEPEAPSSTPSSLSSVSTEKLDTPEQERIAGYLEELDFPFDITPENKSHLEKIAKHVKSLEKMRSLLAHTKNQEHLKGKAIYLGNLANTNNLNGWKQKQQDLAQPPAPKEEKTMKVKDMTMRPLSSLGRR